MNNKELIEAAIAKGLKLVRTDIETSPKLVYVYGSKIDYIDPRQIILPTMITSIAWMTDGEEKVYFDQWDRPKTLKDIYRNLRKDYKMLKRTVPLLNNADFIIGQNLKAFDRKKIQARLCELELPRLNNLLCMDTLTLSRGTMSFDSHKLDARSIKYGFGGKIKQDMTDAIAVAEGDIIKTKERIAYNIKDVDDEQHVFYRELNYYDLPKSLVYVLKMFVQNDEPTFCRKCERLKHPKFNTRRFISKTSISFECNQCNYKWKIQRKEG